MPKDLLAPQNQPQDLLAGQAPARAPTPPEGGENWRDSWVGSFVRGLRDVPDAGAELLLQGLVKMTPEGSGDNKFFSEQLEHVQGINREAEREFREEWRPGMDPEAIDWGRVGGNVAATLPLAAVVPGGAATTIPSRIAQASAIGGSTAALQPVPEGEEFWPTKGEQVALGAALGPVGERLGAGAARVLSPLSSQAVQALRQMGVTPTVGQAGGTVSKAIEERLASLPITGEVIRGAQKRALDQFNLGAINHALRFAGMKLPVGAKAGHEAIESAGNMLSKGYDDLIPQMKAAVDIPFAQDIQRIGQLADDALVGDTLSAFNKQLLKVAQMAKGAKGSIPGVDAKKIISDLGRRSRDLMKSQDVAQRELGGLFGDLKGAFSNALQRGSTPEQAAALRGLDKAYGANLRTTVAAARQGATTEGVFTPAQLKSAVRQLDPTMRKGAFARGTAPMQDIAAMGQEVIGRELPTSGTAERLMAGTALFGGAYIDPVMAATALAPAAAYTPGRFGGQNLLASLIAGRQGPAFQSAAQAVREASPALAAGAGAAAGTLAPR